MAKLTILGWEQLDRFYGVSKIIRPHFWTKRSDFWHEHQNLMWHNGEHQFRGMAQFFGPENARKRPKKPLFGLWRVPRWTGSIVKVFTPTPISVWLSLETFLGGLGVFDSDFAP